MATLRLPVVADDAFREHYRALIVASVAHAPEARAAARHRPWLRVGIRQVASVVWVGVLAVLVADIVVLGVRSPATGAADIALVVMTFVWFFTHA
jgi:hypothetical protein